MATESIIQGIVDYFMECPLLKEGVFRMDALGEEAVEYTIETGMFDPIIKKYIDGSSVRQYQFSFASREFYSMDRIQNMRNICFYEKLAEWVEAQSRKENLPDMPEGMYPRELEVMAQGYIFNNTMMSARYQIPLRLLYYKEA